MTREEKLLKIFEIANKNRDLEIKLYWERSKYFFGFITALLASVLGLTAFLIYKHKELENNNEILVLGSIGLIILSTLLLFFSVGFWLSHKASKFWQENWENILGILERKIFEDDFVYSVIFFRKELLENKNNKENYKSSNSENNKENNIEVNYQYLFHPTHPFFISPSKINANLSIVIVFASYLLFVFSFSLLITVLELTNKDNFNLKLWSVFIYLNVLTILLLLLLKFILRFILLLLKFKNNFLDRISKISKPYESLISIMLSIFIGSLIFIMLYIFIFLAFFLPFHSVIEEIEEINTNLNINTLNQILYWLYLLILFSVIIFIHKSTNDFAKKRRKIIDSYEHKYLITFNIIDDEEYKNDSFNLKGLYFLEKKKEKTK